MKIYIDTDKREYKITGEDADKVHKAEIVLKLDGNGENELMISTIGDVKRSQGVIV